MSRLYPCVYCTEDGYCKKYSDEEVTSWCVQGPCNDEKPSNADRIRAMTDEELAMWINDVTTNALSVLTLGSDKQTKTIFHWLDWLKEEVDDEAD